LWRSYIRRETCVKRKGREAQGYGDPGEKSHGHAEAEQTQRAKGNEDKSP